MNHAWTPDTDCGRMNGDRTTMPPEHRKLIAACSLGALFEWYDFYLYGALAAVLASRFFAALEPRAALLFALLAFAAGFVVRPLGALLFGRLGDLIGRKYTFLVTLLLMGAATFAVGLLPGYETIGVAAPALLVVLRLLQGLAIGGEYGGVATYVAEHAPAQRRGFYTGWIQTTATLGLLLALLVIVGVRAALGEEAFAGWGWRLPFLLSIVLVVLGIWMRLSLAESPPFRRLKQAGRASRRPLTEAFGRWSNLKLVLIALFGLVAGQAVVWYTGQFQALFFLTLVLKVDETTASLLSCAALALGAPLIVGFAALSDRIGRKPIIVAGCVLAAASYFWLFGALAVAANPALVEAQRKVTVTLHADPRECTLPFHAVGEGEASSGCDRARRLLAARSVRFTPVEHDGAASVTIEQQRIELTADGALQRIGAALDAAGYPTHADPARIDRARVVLILLLLLVFVAMVYGPIAATLVEMFATRVRCSSVSLPYHIGNGWFGGLLPATSFGIAAQTGQMLDGLWYPVAVAAAGAVVALLFVRETKDVDIYAGDQLTGASANVASGPQSAVATCIDALCGRSRAVRSDCGSAVAVPAFSGPRSRARTARRALASSTPASPHHRSGDREWGLRPQAPPPHCERHRGVPAAGLVGTGQPHSCFGRGLRRAAGIEPLAPRAAGARLPARRLDAWASASFPERCRWIAKTWAGARRRASAAPRSAATVFISQAVG